MTGRKLLLFRAGGRVFAVDAALVREILPAMPATRIPGSPPAVRGLANVRGTLVTVVDAAQAIGVPPAPAGDAGPVVLVTQRAHPVGLAVDEVCDLVSADAATVEDRAALPGVRPDLVRAVGTAAGLTFVQLEPDVLLEPLLP